MSSEASQVHVVILAAGKGVRMRSKLPKVLHRLCGQSLLERLVRAVAALSPEKITVVCGYGADLVENEINFFRHKAFCSSFPIEIVIQPKQKGTGDAAEVALREIKDDKQDVLILPGDVPLLQPKTLRPVLSSYRSEKPDLLVLTCQHPDPTGFGRIIRNASGHVTQIVEHRDCTKEQLRVREINTSVYLATAGFFKRALVTLDSDNAQGELYLTDIIEYGVKQGFDVNALMTSNYRAVSGVNTRYELSVLEVHRREELNRQWMENGVSMEDPAATYIDEDVQIGAETFLGAGTHIKGKTIVGPSVHIEGNSYLVDAQIGEGTLIKLGCRIEEAVVGKRCAVGPFAQLRPGVKLHDEVRIGNFVECKQAEFRRGSKANHLAYIGDATIGVEANIGAGTITANYDGFNKHQTVVGDGASVGSNSVLIAPINVGEGAYIGAGSALSKDVPADSLAIERSERTIVKDWAKKWRKKNEKGKA